MRYAPFLPLILASLATGPVWGQPAPRQSFVETPHSTVVPPLPAPPLDDDASPVQFLRAAEQALAAGRVGEARAAMEMAQTRMLDREVPLWQTDTPSDQQAVRLISQGLRALNDGDRASGLRMIQAAIIEISR